MDELQSMRKQQLELLLEEEAKVLGWAEQLLSELLTLNQSTNARREVFDRIQALSKAADDLQSRYQNVLEHFARDDFQPRHHGRNVTAYELREHVTHEQWHRVLSRRNRVRVLTRLLNAHLSVQSRVVEHVLQSLTQSEPQQQYGATGRSSCLLTHTLLELRS